MQTLLFVLGPFILYVLGGLGLVFISLMIGNWILAKARLMNAQRVDIEQVRAYNDHVVKVLDSAVVQAEINPILRNQLEDSLINDMHQLRVTNPARKSQKELDWS